MRNNRTKPDRAEFWEKLAATDFENDCVAVFRPGGGIWFHVPDQFIDQLREDKPIPIYVTAVLMHAHLLTHIEDPTVRAYYEKFRDQLTLDAITADEEPRT